MLTVVRRTRTVTTVTVGTTAGAYRIAPLTYRWMVAAAVGVLAGTLIVRTVKRRRR